MQDQLAQLFYYAKGALRYKWLALIVAWLVCLGGWLFVFAMPNKYASEAKVHVETKTMLQPLLRGMTIQSDTAGLLRIMQVLMFTRNNIEQIIKMSDLNKQSDTIDQSALIEKLKKDIKIEGGRDDIFTIKYEATSATLAKNVVQAVLTVFSEQTHQSTLAGTDVAKKFIDDQIQEYETRLRNAEQAKENFKRANLGLLPGEGGGHVTQAQSAASLLDDAKLQLSEALSRQKALTEQLNGIKDSDEDWAVADFGGDLTEEDSRIEALNLRKKELLVRFTENHPEIVSINNTIKGLEEVKQKTEKKGAIDDMFVKPNVMANPYVQTVKVALNEADAAVASAKARVDELKICVEKIGEEMQSRLAVETGLQNLNRDYDSIKKNYEQLLESREQASMSEKVDDQAEALKFKIADAPNVPLKPSSPKRMYFYSGLLVVGFIFGFSLSLLLYMTKPTIMSASQLGQITGLPVLGGVSIKNNSIELSKNKNEIVRYYCAVLGLVLIYLGFMTVEALEINFTSIAGLLHRIT
ncbi:MAG: hypothetical protein Q7U66_08585 [Methylobacter sp.]|nr:hypothetical protein [Methylobacter sp.]